jgi:tRNA A-37 threonylcarbamoyl transferase component Bud32/Tol biopolymer transport system component
MPLTAGTILGSYEILSPLGAGGMGEVYRARDLRLRRQVAVKVLPERLAGDPGALARFEREARAVAALSHPNLLALFDVGRSGGIAFAVLELLEGETLRSRLAAGALPQRKALELALQIARGLAAAHARGIVHRDLKPENLFLTRDGQLKILDFGLARQGAAPGPDGQDSDLDATLTRELSGSDGLTEPGMVLGTAGYMSPEQARGRVADFRSDLFAFGAVFYEMLAGRPAFRRDTPLETLTAVLREEPPDLPATVPSALDRIVRHCLEKNPEARFHSASDLAFQLGTELAERSGTGGRRPVSRAPGRRRAWAPALVALLLAGGAGVFLGRWLWPSAAAPLPTFRQLTFRRGTIQSARFAPDGATIVYGAAWAGAPVRLFTTRTDSYESTALPLPDADVLSVSRSGEMALSLGRRFLGNPFASTGTLAQAALAGGGTREILRDVHQADWAPDGIHLAVLRGSATRLRLEYPIGKALFESGAWLDKVRVSPRGDLVAFFEVIPGSSKLFIVDREGHQKLSVSMPGWPVGLAWHPSGEEVWLTYYDSQGSSLEAVRMTGEKRTLLRLPGGIDLLDVAAGGRALLALKSFSHGITGLGPGETRARDLSWFDGTVAKDLSDDGRTVLFDEQGSNYGRSNGVYLRGMDGSPAVQLGPGLTGFLSPDGRWALSRDRQGNSPVLLPTGPGSPRALPRMSLKNTRIHGWFPDGRHLLASGEEPGRPSRLYEMDLAGGKMRPFTPYGVGIPPFTAPISPDGRQVVGWNLEGRPWIYPVGSGTPRPLPGLLPGDELVRWSGDGRAIFLWRRFDSPLRVFRLDLATGERRLLREISFLDPVGLYTTTNLLLTPDGGSYVYSYGRLLSTLYLVEGLK